MAKPLYSSEIPIESLPEAGKSLGEIGAKLMRIEPMPVQREIWNLVEARTPLGLPLHENQAIEVPRRAGKTDGIFSEALGRCLTRMDYEITYCAQSGVKSRDRFYSLLRRLNRTAEGTFKTRESRGEEQFEFPTGSVLRFRPPKSSSFRGDALDWVILDEAQEVDEEDAADLVGSLLPIFDTREDAQLTVAGTAGAQKSGLLWDSLEKGRAGTWGILEYAMDTEKLDKDNPEHWLEVHPGPAGVSRERAMTVLLKRYEEMKESGMFYREYLGIWPEGKAQSAFSKEIWARLGREMPERPKRFALAFDVTPSGTRSAVMAVWRDADKVAWVEVLKEGGGSKWVAGFVGGVATKFKVPVGYDTAGVDTLAVADEIARKYRNVKLHGLTTIEFATGCAVFSNEVHGDNLRHARQPALTQAVENASRRPIRDGGWAWGRKLSTGSIATLVAATAGLRVFDSMPVERSLTILTAKPA